MIESLFEENFEKKFTQRNRKYDENEIYDFTRGRKFVVSEPKINRDF